MQSATATHTDIEEWPLYKDGVMVNNTLLFDIDPEEVDYEAFDWQYIPYLNGRPVRWVGRANASEGWVDVWYYTKDWTEKKVKRFHGSVQLLRSTKEMMDDFKKNGVRL